MLLLPHSCKFIAIDWGSKNCIFIDGLSLCQMFGLNLLTSVTDSLSCSLTWPKTDVAVSFLSDIYILCSKLPLFISSHTSTLYVASLAAISSCYNGFNSSEGVWPFTRWIIRLLIPTPNVSFIGRTVSGKLCKRWPCYADLGRSKGTKLVINL